MEAAPPSYQKATLMDPWHIIARYIPSNDLCSAALVNSRWHTTFTPHLWGNPASHFGTENDDVYIALTKFKRTLQTARLLVRSQTHTLHLPPAHAELYNGPHATWLRDILDRLPNLQSLIVRGLPFFDYSALQALKYKKPGERQDDGHIGAAFELPGSDGMLYHRQTVDFIPSFGLRLLDASRCPNITANSLAQALRRFESLLYLDLSFTHPAHEAVVLQALTRFAGLQVVKLRGVGLHDDMLTILASSIGRRVRSLDVRDNHVSDRGIRTLLEDCFTTDNETNDSLHGGQRSPVLLSYLGHEMLDIYQGEDFESFIRNTFTGRFMGKMAIEDAPEGGITHLYISGNQVSVEGISGLVRSRRLHVFDVESASTVVRSPVKAKFLEEVEGPGVEKLTPLLAGFASEGMKFLRIDHALVTKDAGGSGWDAFAPGSSELDSAAIHEVPDTHQMDATSSDWPVFELSSERAARYELAGEDVRVSSPSGDEKKGNAHGTPVGGPRRGSAFAPEVAESSLLEANDTMSSTGTLPQYGAGTFTDYGAMILSLASDEKHANAFSKPENGPRRGSAVAPQVAESLLPEFNGPPSFAPVSPQTDTGTFVGTWTGTVVDYSAMTLDMTSVSPEASGIPSPRAIPPPRGIEKLSPPHVGRSRTYSSVADERRARLSAHIANRHNLHPAMLPNLSTLILTNVPPFSPTKEVSDRLIHFIRQCAREQQLALLSAKLDWAFPPGRKGHAAALKHSTERIFALKRIVLELGPADSTQSRSRRASQWQHASTKSVTEDHDSESLWSAAATDFSFFGEEAEESYPSLAAGRYSYGFLSNEKEIQTQTQQQAPAFSSSPPAAIAQLPPPKFDNIALLSAFRTERKLAHARSVAAGNVAPETEGFWDGVIQVRRMEQGDPRVDDAGDYHSTRFDKGNLYR